MRFCLRFEVRHSIKLVNLLEPGEMAKGRILNKGTHTSPKLLVLVKIGQRVFVLLLVDFLGECEKFDETSLDV